MELTCNKCGKVHYGITLDDAYENVDEFNEMYDNLTPAEQTRYYKRQATISDYEKCNTCGNSMDNFRIATDDDCPIGATLSPIIMVEHNVS